MFSKLIAHRRIHYQLICTFIGGYFEKGAWPWASSNAVIPKDQMSALHDYANQTLKSCCLIILKSK
jgi:hypothetical protein